MQRSPKTNRPLELPNGLSEKGAIFVPEKRFPLNPYEGKRKNEVSKDRSTRSAAMRLTQQATTVIRLKEQQPDLPRPLPHPRHPSTFAFTALMTSYLRCPPRQVPSVGRSDPIPANGEGSGNNGRCGVRMAAVTGPQWALLSSSEEAREQFALCF